MEKRYVPTPTTSKVFSLDNPFGQQALERAKRYYNCYDEYRFCIIKVDNSTYAIAHFYHNDYIGPICDIVFPFDGNKCYPMQAVKLDYTWLPYNEYLGR